MRRAAWGAFVAVCIAACGDASETVDTDTSADAGTDAPVDAVTDATEALSGAEWCRESNAVWCEWMYRCFTPEDLETAETAFHFDDEATCAAVLAADCQGRTMRSVTEGRQTFDGAAASVCLDALAAEACGTWEALIAGDALNPPECADVTTGVVAPGETCTNTLDCASPDAWCWTDTATPYCTDTLGAAAFQRECATGGDARADVDTTVCSGALCLQVDPSSLDWEGVCSARCRVDRNCGPDAGCFQREGEEPACLATCTNDDQCADGLVCRDLGGRGACYVPE